MSRRCRACGAPLDAVARFCGACGTASRDHQKQVAARGASERVRMLRAALALGCACVGTLFGLLGGVAALAGEGSEWTAPLAGTAAVAGAALLAGLVGGSLRRSLPLAVRWPWLAAAVPAAALSLGAALVWIALWPAPPDREPRVAGAALWVGAVVLAPLVEEWLCRGVAWQAANALAPRLALVLTAVLFGFLHGLGGHLLAVPHRFVSGLLYGWLRSRSGSVLPAIAAHALHNAVCVAWLGG